jgi:cyclic pyranopterin phosphate synthase
VGETESTLGEARSRLIDASGRHLEYLRLAVTERCNFRCTYCLPAGCSNVARAPLLSIAEIERLVRGFADLGIWKVRLTGGEPTLRPDILEIVARVAATPRIRHVGMTTNGYRLESIAEDLAAAGLTCLNVSVDSLDPGRFASITGGADLATVVRGVEAALAAGIPRVKVNAVLLAGTDGAELDRFLAWARDVPLTIRFVELMATAGDPGFFAKNHTPAAEIARLLAERGWVELPRVEGGGPAVDHGHPGHRGRIGIIAPYRTGFCERCNRLRVSASGNLRLCLFHDRELSLRQLLQSDTQRRALAEVIRAAAAEKPGSRELDERPAALPRSLASIGG